MTVATLTLFKLILFYKKYMIDLKNESYIIHFYKLQNFKLQAISCSWTPGVLQ